MAEGFNRVVLLGNLGADPDLRSTQGGQSVLRLRLATTERYLDQTKEWKERTEWHNVTVWGKRGEALHRILTKGSTIFVEGSLRTTSYDKDGVKMYKTEVVAQNIVLTGGRPGAERGNYDAGPPAQRSGGGGGGSGGGNYGGGRPAQPAPQRSAPQEEAPGDDYDAYQGSDDDIPFLSVSRRLILVRHGAVENPARVRYGRLPGFSLSEQGRAQAARSAEFLAACSLRAPLFLSSPLERAVETAEILARRVGVSIQTEERLVEIGSRYDGLPWKFAPALYWKRQLDPALRGRDEPLSLVAARIVETLSEACRQHDGDVVAISHQIPIRAALLALTRGLDSLDGPLPSNLWLRWKQPINPGYAQVFELSPQREHRWSLVRQYRPD